jgi:DHA1 family inner membrane transport protein
VLLWRLAPGAPGRPADPVAPVARFVDFLRDPFARTVYAAIFAEGFLLWGAVTYLGAYATSRYGLGQLPVGLLVALFGVGTMVGGALMARLRRRLSENGLAGGGGLLMGVALLMIIPGGGPLGSWPVFAAAMLLLGLGFVGLHTTLQVRATDISQAARGKAFSLFPASLFAGVAAGTAAMAPIVDRGGEVVVLALCGTGLVVVGLVTARIRRGRTT